MKIQRRRFLAGVLLILSLFKPLLAISQIHIERIDTGTYVYSNEVNLSKISFRGLSVVDDSTIWVSGSQGTIARSTNGGKSFQFLPIAGYAKSDFRDIEAFNATTAIVMSSGTPAVILKTTDGGAHWQEVFRRNDSAYFLDAMDFWNEWQGVVVGDPIQHHFVLLLTSDGGKTWEEVDTNHAPAANEGEAVFAASGTSLRCWGNNAFGFVTGGASARFIHKNDKNGAYRYVETGLSQKSVSAGTFSFTVYNNIQVLFSGGDYRADTIKVSTISGCTMDGNRIATQDAGGYRSCIEQMNDQPLFIVCGTSGVDIGYNTWEKISKEGFHVVRKAKKGKSVFLAGSKGKIGKLKVQ